MTTAEWEKVAPGRYALAYLGHTLEVILNPDFPALDNRRYLAVVDHKPLEPKSWLNGAKTACIMHVQKVGRFTRAHEEFDKAVNGTHVELDQSEPEPDQSEPEPDQSEIIGPPARPQIAEPEPIQLDDSTGRFAITGRITDTDSVRAYAAIKSMVELLREHADVECSITMPSVLKL